MCHFQQVRDHQQLPAVTHVDGTARTRTVTAHNTSLNFNGAAVINRTSDLVDYVLTRGLDGVVLDCRFYHTRKPAA